MSFIIGILDYINTPIQLTDVLIALVDSKQDLSFHTEHNLQSRCYLYSRL